MNKLFTKIAGSIIGMAMAIGVGVGLGRGEVRQAKALEDVAYTLTPASTGNNSYTSNADAEIDGVTWNVEGNGTLNSGKWRLGGKSGNTSNADRRVYSKDAVSTYDITKVELTVGTASGITVNSLNLLVGTSAGGSQTSSVAGSFVASSTITFNRPNGADWSSKYFTFNFNLTSGNASNNKFVEFTEAKFYKEGGTSYTISTTTNGLTLSDNSTTASGGNITLTTAAKKKGSNVQVSNTATSSVSGNVVSLSNVTGNVTINCTIVDASITDFTITGQKTAFTLSDSWSFGGTVTATYDDWVSPHTSAALESTEYTVDNSNFVAGTEGTYTISVTAGSVTKTYDVEVADSKYYTLVESTNDLIDGADVILVTNKTTASVSGRYAMTKTISSSLNGFAAVSISANGILKTSTIDSYSYSLEQNGDNWDLYNQSETKYLLSEQNKKMKEDSSATSHWSISVSNGVATLTSTYDEAVGHIMFNWNSGNARFTTYTGDESATMILPSIYQYDSGASSTSYDVIDSVTNGSLSVDSIKEGRTLNATIVPDAKYAVPESITSVTMDGDPVEFSYSNGVVTVENVSGDIEITASCAKAKGLWQDNPFTVAEAKAAIDSQSTISGAFVTGIISQIDSFNSNYNSITYWISDDGETTGQQLEVYSGRGLNNVNFSAIDDIEEGATVIITGNLKKYNSTYEFDLNNYLVSYTAPVHTTPTITLSESHARLVMGGESAEIVVTAEAFTNTPTIAVEGDTPAKVNVSISGLTITLTPKALGSETITIKGTNSSETNSKELTVVVTSHAGTKNDPYSVADAISVVDAISGASNVYLSGIVSSVGELSSGALTYLFSDDGTTTTEFEAYKGKGLNGASFDATTDVAVGDSVVVLGSIKKYTNAQTSVTTYEFDTGCQLVNAKEFARALLNQTNAVCSGYDGVTDNQSSLSSIWSTLGGANYWGAIPTSQQSIFKAADPNYDNDSDDILENAAGRYNYLCKKYFSTENFANRTDVNDAPVSSQSNLDVFGIINNKNNTAIIITVISVLSLTALGGFFFIKKRKEQ